MAVCEIGTLPLFGNAGQPPVPPANDRAIRNSARAVSRERTQKTPRESDETRVDERAEPPTWMLWLCYRLGGPRGNKGAVAT